MEHNCEFCVSAAPGGMQEFNMGGPWKVFCIILQLP